MKGNRMEFKVGEIVKLKSGGPKITISEVIDDDEAICLWFVNDERRVETFEVCALDKVMER
jgi:uncharacterized protein YodC (DUF2158 family)